MSAMHTWYLKVTFLTTIHNNHPKFADEVDNWVSFLSSEFNQNSNSPVVIVKGILCYAEYDIIESFY